MCHSFSVIAGLATRILTWFAPLCDWGFLNSQQKSLSCSFPRKSCNNSSPCNYLSEILDIEIIGLTFPSKSVGENLDGSLNAPKNLALLHIVVTVIFPDG